MSKSNLKLDLNKQVVSKLQAKQILGGGGTAETGDSPCHYHLIHFKSDRPGECGWSYHTNSNDSPN